MQPSIHPLTPPVGAEVRGVDLRAPLSAEQREFLEAALLAHGVLFFRDQDISPADHLALARAFGEPVPHPSFPSVPGFDAVNILRVTPDEEPKIDTWHTDMTFLEAPPLGSILRARVIPACGGDTLFGSTIAAYDSLSPTMKRRLEGLHAAHSFTHGFRHSLAEPDASPRLRAAAKTHPPRVHPVVRVHPRSGKPGLFVNRLFTTHILDLPERESDSLLAYLYEHLEQPEHTCRFRWSPNAIAFWDNRCTIHRPVNDYWPAHRELERVTIAGDVPVGPAQPAS